MRRLFLHIAVITIFGCVGPLVPVKKIDELPVSIRREVLAMLIYNESQLIGRQYRVINIVEGISCKNKTWDPAATKTDAINQAKYWAHEMGADALMNIQCEFPRGTTITYNCWESITCTAQAIKLEEE
jgi:uncharacterized protein YbjQ (UPF0145 family)